MAGPSKQPEKRQASLTSFFTPRTVNGLSQNKSRQPEDEPGAVGTNEASSSSPLRKRPLEEATDHGNDGPASSVKRTKSKDDRAPERSTFFSKSSPKSAAGTSTVPKGSRTERYAFDEARPTNLAATTEDDGEDAAVRQQKEDLHRKFVKKLGHPDSMAMIRRRNFQMDDETATVDEGGDGDDADEEDPAQSKATGKKKGAKTGKLTPMEIQFLDIKRKHLDTLLIVEVGYKFKFFGEDARIAAKELSIVCIPGKFRYDERR